MRRLAMFHANDAYRSHSVSSCKKAFAWRMAAFLFGNWQCSFLGLGYFWDWAKLRMYRTKERRRMGEHVSPGLHPWIRTCFHHPSMRVSTSHLHASPSPSLVSLCDESLFATCLIRVIVRHVRLNFPSPISRVCISMHVHMHTE